MRKISFLFIVILLSIGHAQLFAQETESDTVSQDYAVPVSYRASETRYFDLLHTDLAVSFDWEKEQLIGTAKLSLKPYFYAQEDLTLDAKAMAIQSVMLLDSQGGTKKLTYDYDGSEIQIRLDRIYERTDTLELAIDYIAKPNELPAGGSEAITEDKGLYFINADGKDPNKPQQIWTQGETEASSVWFPTIDAPNERCTQSIAMTVQDKFNTLSNGILTSQKDNGDGTRTDRWVLDIPHAPYLFMMSVGEYAVIRDQWRDISVSYHVEKKYEADAQAIFGHTPEMMEFFSEKLGVDYPWPKYDQVVVRDYVSGAMENTTASVFMEGLQVQEKELLDFNWDDIIAHELFHQWFGDYVTCESWSNLTLNEGFASYSEYLWNEYKYGVDEADYNLLNDREAYLDEAEEESKDLIRFYYEDREDMFDTHSYNKGAAVIHMLRNYLGDEAFFAGLNLYLTQNALSSVEINDLRMAFEEVSGEDLNWFFDQWFFFPGHPEIMVSETYENDTLTLLVQQVQGDDSPVYKLPLFVEIWSEGKSANYPIILEEAVETYEFALTKEPELVVFDTERQLLGTVTHAKSPEALAFQMTHSRSFQSRLEVVESLDEITDKKLIQQILTQALQDPHYIIQEFALDYMIEKEIKPKKYQALLDQAYTHESSNVRSYVISYLAETDFEENQDKIVAALDDPSFLVQSTAMTFLLRNGETVSEELVQSFSKETNINVVLAMSEYYLTRTGEASFQWFADKAMVVDDEALYFLLQVYSEKLVNASEVRRKEAVVLYSDIARNHPTYFTRLAAYQGLVLMSDLDGVNDLLDEIKAGEKDERLQAYYEQF
ncbi:M1 family aminopeptidase [Reichenbachiella agariperforans]|uniref:M1 family aminopeptidase n=1 Tax=Reichenbachiella agariperforans TaxID=156994 RepID=UPI001C094215|nr:M1 family aminopeptidase [Reichenbachiella agariperforans]MBU2914560.1 M1 family peptidase [Reichenbachiella agariperforans]